jgi:hypothetical protein
VKLIHKARELVAEAKHNISQQLQDTEVLVEMSELLDNS